MNKLTRRAYLNSSATLKTVFHICTRSCTNLVALAAGPQLQRVFSLSLLRTSYGKRGETVPLSSKQRNVMVHDYHGAITAPAGMRLLPLIF